MQSIPEQETKKLLQVELPEPWMRHIDVEAAKRGIKRKGLVLRALQAFLGSPPDYDAEVGAEPDAA